MVSLGSLLADSQERGLVMPQCCQGKEPVPQKGKDRRHERRQRGKLKVGVDIPSREEVKAIVGALAGRWRPLLLTAILPACGRRSCEGYAGATWI